MKARLGFVSNSSSSSCVIGHCPEGVRSVKLTAEQRALVREYLLGDEYMPQDKFAVLDQCPEWWLTRFLFDGGDDGTFSRIVGAPDSVFYTDGEMSGMPYEPDAMLELTGNRYGEDGVWIYRDHSPIHKVVKPEELAKALDEMFHAPEYRIEIKSNMVEVRPYEV